MKHKIANIVLYAVSVPVALFEYFVLVWFWSGAGIFNLILTPLIFIIYLIIIMYLKKKCKIRNLLLLHTKLFTTLILPLLTIITVWLFAFLLGIKIIIW